MRKFIQHQAVHAIGPLIFVTLATFVIVSPTPAEEISLVMVKYSVAKGIGQEAGVMRRDPSDIIKVGELFYVWYSKGAVTGRYDATVLGNHEVLVWPQGEGVAAMIGTVGPKTLTRSIQYAANGVDFSKTHEVPNVPSAAGAYRPEAFTNSGSGEMIQWGVHIGNTKRSLPFIERFVLQPIKR